jgi:hypothetical protein
MSEPNESQPSIPHLTPDQLIQSPSVTLDGKPVEIALTAMESISSIRAHLELMALRQERVLSGLSVDGVEISLLHPPDWTSPYRLVAGRTISLHDYSRQLLLRVLQQVHQVCTRTEELVLVVLINDWPAMEWLWRTLQSDIQAPMIKLGLLQEFFTLQAQTANPDASQVGVYWREFRSTWHRLDEVYQRHDKFALSDALEQDLLPWLNRLRGCLISLERSASTHDTP